MAPMQRRAVRYQPSLIFVLTADGWRTWHFDQAQANTMPKKRSVWRGGPGRYHGLLLVVDRKGPEAPTGCWFLLEKPHEMKVDMVDVCLIGHAMLYDNPQDELG